MRIVSFDRGHENQSGEGYRHIPTRFFLCIDDLAMVNDDSISGIPLALGPANAFREG